MSPGRIVAFASILEIATGIALLAVPALVFTLLLGGALPAEIAPLARVAGIAMLALGIGCWPERVNATTAAMNGMLAYNALVAGYLAYVGGIANLGGILLWPAVALHAVIAALLVWTRRA